MGQSGVKVSRCEHLEPKEEWPYVAGRCKNEAESGSDYCSEHQRDDE
jgi:hypothetical protein